MSQQKVTNPPVRSTGQITASKIIDRLTEVPLKKMLGHLDMNEMHC
jgi:hypothetical protein